MGGGALFAFFKPTLVSVFVFFENSALCMSIGKITQSHANFHFTVSLLIIPDALDVWH